MNYTKLGIEKLEEALAILNSGVWNFYKRTIDGDSIYTRKLPDGHTVLRLTVRTISDELIRICFKAHPFMNVRNI